MRFRSAGLIAVALGVSVSVADAQSVATRGVLNSILTSSTIETFAAIANSYGGQTQVNGPVVNNASDSRFVAGVTYSSVGSIVGYGTNMFSPGPGYYAYGSDAFEAGSNAIRLKFDVFTQAFGLDVAQYNGYAETATWSIYRGVTLLGSGSILAANAPNSSFLGWQDAGGIDYVEISGGYGWSPSVDNVQWGTTAAPEPASMVLMATGLLSLAGVQIRRRKTTAA